MIFLVFALKIEAEPFINKLELKKVHNINKTRIYKRENIVALITGTGLINAAASLSYGLSKYYNNKNDIIINIGIAGGPKELKIGDPVLINKIIGVDGNEFFPDISEHPFKEGTLKTVLKTEIKNDKNDNYLQDLEGEALYCVSQNYVYQNNIHLIKIVSDFKDIDYLNKVKVVDILNKNKKEIINYINYLKDKSLEYNNKEKILSEKEADLIEVVANNLNLSVYLKNEFVKKSIDYKNRKNNLIKLLKKYDSIIVSNKLDRGKYYDEIKSELELYKN